MCAPPQPFCPLLSLTDRRAITSIHLLTCRHHAHNTHHLPGPPPPAPTTPPQDHATPHPPFLVIASNDISEELAAAEPPLFWPERRYPWGTAEAFNKEHSDLLAVR